MEYYRSRFSESRYFTPPKIQPLNLDLVKLSGGGSLPAQYDGETVDGRIVYCRYRGGKLSVRVGNKPNADCFEDGVEVLSVIIGPPFSGRMSIGKLCSYTGITVNGEIPIDPDVERRYQSEEGDCGDLSGDTTFYDVWLVGTLMSQKRIIDSAIARFPEATFIQPVWNHGPGKYNVRLQEYQIFDSSDELGSDNFCIFFGDPPNLSKLLEISDQRLTLGDVFPESTIVSGHVSGFQFSALKYSSASSDLVFDLVGKKVAVAGQVDDCLHGNFSLHSRFLNKSSDKRRILEEIDALVDKIFPKYRISYVNLETGEEEPERQYYFHLDPRIVDWIDAQKGRYLAVVNWGDHEKPHFVGQVAHPAP